MEMDDKYPSVAEMFEIMQSTPFSFFSFHCNKCGLVNDDKDYAHTDEECIATEVLLK